MYICALARLQSVGFRSYAFTSTSIFILHDFPNLHNTPLPQKNPSPAVSFTRINPTLLMQQGAKKRKNCSVYILICWGLQDATLPC